MTLKEWLEIKGWTEADLSRETGLTRQAVNKWMQGGRVSPENAEMIEKMTGGEVSYRDLTKGNAA